MLRIGSTLLLGGLVAEYVVTSLHPAHQNPNDHHAVFAEYAASDNWIAVHLGQFAAGMIVIAGIITLLRALRPPTGPSLLTRIAEAAAILTASAIAVLQGIDGFTLKHAVDSLASAPRERTTRRSTTPRSSAGSNGRRRLLPHHPRPHRCADRCRDHPLTHSPRWSAPLALLAGLAFIADGVVVGTDGFTGGVPTWSPGQRSSCSPSPRPPPPGGATAATSPPRSQIVDTDRNGAVARGSPDGTAEDRPGGTPCAGCCGDPRRPGCVDMTSRSTVMTPAPRLTAPVDAQQWRTAQMQLAALSTDEPSTWSSRCRRVRPGRGTADSEVTVQRSCRASQPRGQAGQSPGPSHHW